MTDRALTMCSSAPTKLQVETTLKPVLNKMQTILRDSPMCLDSYGALRIILVMTAIEDIEARFDAFSAAFGSTRAKTLNSWLKTLKSTLHLSSLEFRALILSTMKQHRSRALLPMHDLSEAGEWTSIVQNTEAMIQDSLRLWLQTDEGRSNWKSQTFKNAVMFALYIGNTSNFCSDVLSNVLASDARRLDQCKITVDESLFDEDFLIRLIDVIAKDCNDHLTSLYM